MASSPLVLANRIFGDTEWKRPIQIRNVQRDRHGLSAEDPIFAATSESLMGTHSRRDVLCAMATGFAALALPMRAHAQEAQDLSFLVIGDWGHAGSPVLKQVADQMGRTAADIDARFVITTGDNFYEAGVSGLDDPLWRSAFEDVFVAPSLMRPWYPVLGNHDHQGSVEAQLGYSEVSARWRMPAPYYKHSEALPYGNIADFFHLDTMVMIRPGLFDEWFWDRQLAWLEDALSASKASWKIVVGHHPVYSGGQHGSTPQLVEKLALLFRRHGVQIYLNGHDHDLQHIVVENVHYITSGAASEVRETKAIAGTQFAASESGFVAGRLTSQTLMIEMIDAAGRVRYRREIQRAV